MIPWPRAWHQALYGPEGFYRCAEGPAGHFTTSTHPPLGAVFAEVIVALARRERLTRVVDVGCGRGELVTAIRSIAPDLEVTGVDIIERPEHLDPAIGWLRSPGGGTLPPTLHGLRHTLLVAHEFLDVIPCPILQIDDTGTPREVLVDPATGQESLSAGPVAPESLAWCAEHWPLGGLAPGERVEVGLPRDLVWLDLLDRLDSGTLVAIDYGHRRADRPAEGTLTAYARGIPTTPIPDGSCDITAHVAMDSLPGASVTTQREALHDLGVIAPPAPRALAESDPASYLRQFSRQSILRQLRDPHGLGGFLWATASRPLGEAERHTAD